MIRGLYTGALGMVARDIETETIANNLANVSTPAYKRDEAVFRAFPEMLLRRFDDEPIRTPGGSIDPAPAVGRLGTGVRVDDVVTEHAPGPMRESSDPLDIAVEGDVYAMFAVQTPRGVRWTRAGNLRISREGFLVLDGTGDLVLGEGGPLRGRRENLRVLPDGTIETNAAYQGGLNRWEAPVALDRLRLRVFDDPRGLAKEGHLLYRETPEAGAATPPAGGVEIRAGWLEMSNANVAREMVNLILAQRGYEANSRVVQNYDQILAQTNQINR